MLTLLPLLVKSGSQNQNGHCQGALKPEQDGESGSQLFVSFCQKGESFSRSPHGTSPYVSRTPQVSKGAGKAGNKIPMIDLDHCETLQG